MGSNVIFKFVLHFKRARSVIHLQENTFNPFEHVEEAAHWTYNFANQRGKVLRKLGIQ